MPKGIYKRTGYHREINRSGQLKRFSKLSEAERKLICGHNKGKSSPSSTINMLNFWDKLKKEPENYKNFCQKRITPEKIEKCRETTNTTIAKMSQEERRKRFGGHLIGRPSPNKMRYWKKCPICENWFDMIKFEYNFRVTCSMKCRNQLRKIQMSIGIIRNPMSDPILKAKAIRNRLKARKSPNGEELMLCPILEEYGFRYVGDGSFIINKVNPDFINEKRKLAIEFAGTYWHNKNYEIERPKKFEEVDWKCLVIWESEITNMENVRKKVSEWAYLI